MVGGPDFSTNVAVLGDELFGGSDRLKRFFLLTTHVNKNDLLLFQDGEFSKLLFIEMLESFVNAQFIATIQLGFSFIERVIAGRVSFVDDSANEKTRSFELFKIALQKTWLTPDECTQLKFLLDNRNAIVHFRDQSNESRPEIVAVMNTKTLPQQLEADANKILVMAIHILKKTSL